GDVLERGLDVGADYAREAADLLADDGVPFVRHRRGTFLPGGEGFLRFANFGALEVADLGGDLFAERGGQRERGYIGRVAIARDDLAGDGRGLETEALADHGFGFRADVAEGSDGARDFADAHVFGSRDEAGAAAAGFIEEEREFKAEGDGL